MQTEHRIYVQGNDVVFASNSGFEVEKPFEGECTMYPNGNIGDCEMITGTFHKTANGYQFKKGE